MCQLKKIDAVVFLLTWGQEVFLGVLGLAWVLPWGLCCSLAFLGPALTSSSYLRSTVEVSECWLHSWPAVAFFLLKPFSPGPSAGLERPELEQEHPHMNKNGKHKLIIYCGLDTPSEDLSFHLILSTGQKVGRIIGLVL